MILLQALLISTLFESTFCSIKTNFDPDLNKLEGLVCYQCKVADEYCHPSKFLTSPKKAKLDMLIQCPQDCKYCLKREVHIDEEKYEVDRSCSKAVDSLGQIVRAGCMVTDKMEICLCTKNLCNSANSFIKKTFSAYYVYLLIFLNIYLYCTRS